jgi:hypothetical protein
VLAIATIVASCLLFILERTQLIWVEWTGQSNLELISFISEGAILLRNSGEKELFVQFVEFSAGGLTENIVVENRYIPIGVVIQPSQVKIFDIRNTNVGFIAKYRLRAFPRSQQEEVEQALAAVDGKPGVDFVYIHQEHPRYRTWKRVADRLGKVIVDLPCEVNIHYLKDDYIQREILTSDNCRSLLLEDKKRWSDEPGIAHSGENGG